MSWSAGGWRGGPRAQMPDYPDAAALSKVEARLAASAPLVAAKDILRLKAQLAAAAAGRAFLLQGGDCAESFAEFGADKVRATFDLLRGMGARLRPSGSGTSGPGEIVHLARIAGQFAKPRSSAHETIGGVTLPSYRGDAVNGSGFTPGDRTPDPERLLVAHAQAEATIALLDGYAATDGDAPRMFTSHEGLLLGYEQALTRFDPSTGRWWATSGHMIWIGDRTRALDGGHVDYARGIANPIGLKCGPTLDANDLLQLIDRLDPDDTPGRLVLIGRFGAGRIAAHLPALMRATRSAGRRVLWSIDPMHGNTRDSGGVKTRRVADIVAEIADFFAIARAEGVHPGGVHLEMTGEAVTECVGGGVAEGDLSRRYLTHCDPRLNRDQALEVAAEIARLLEPAALRAVAA